MLGKTDICNIALSLVGADTISDIEEPTKEAKGCRVFYENARRRLLSLYDWSFAARTLRLNKAQEDPEVPGNRYKLPSDFISLRDVTNAPEGAAYSTAGGYLYIDLDKAFIRYTADVTDVSFFPPLFADALAASLASDLAVYLTDGREIASGLERSAEYKISAAIREDATASRRSTVETVSPLTSARRGI